MAFRDTIKGDYRNWVDRESVTYHSRSRGGDVSYSLTDCKGRAISRRELAASAGVYTAQDRVWLLPTEIIPAGLSPKPADLIVDSAGTRWTVTPECGLNTLGTWWRMICRDLVLSAQLREMVSVHRPDAAQDASGNHNPTYSAIYNQVPSRVQVRTKQRVEVRGKYLLESTVDVYVAGPLELFQGDQVRDELGVVYEVQGHGEPDRIDQLQVIYCKRWE